MSTGILLDFAYRKTGLSPRAATYPQLGELIRSLRPEGMTIREAAARGRKKGVRDMTYTFLWRLEQGQIKHPPTRQQVEGLSMIYGVPYAPLASKVAQCVYECGTLNDTNSLDVTPNTGAVSTTVGSNRGGQDSPPSTQERVRALEAGFRDILDVAIELLGKKAGARINDAGISASGIRRTREEEAREGPRRDGARARSTGARR